MATQVVSARVDEATKRKADAVIKANNTTPNDVIKQLWETIASTGTIPLDSGTEQQKFDEQRKFQEFVAFLDTAPEPNPAFAHMNDEEILATRVDDYA